jgi:hypothetical protein
MTGNGPLLPCPNQPALEFGKATEISDDGPAVGIRHLPPMLRPLCLCFYDQWEGQRPRAMDVSNSWLPYLEQTCRMWSRWYQRLVVSDIE